MQFALMIYHTPEEFAMRKNDYSDPHLGAWRRTTRRSSRPASTSAPMLLKRRRRERPYVLRRESAACRMGPTRDEGATGRIHHPGTPFH